MMPSALDERRHAESRARIIARLRSAEKAEKAKAGKGEAATTSRAKPVLLKPVLPKFVEQTQGRTACFVARAEALSCQFLTGGQAAEKKTAGKMATEKMVKEKVIAKAALGKVLRDFFVARRGKKAAPLLLFDALEKAFWERLGILKILEGRCRPVEMREGVEGRDFATSPFPAFSLQRAVCAVAETGTLVFANRTRAQAVLTFLPTVHIVLLAERDITGSLEQAFARVQPSSSRAALWACHLVSGPSRTADIEQTLHMGAHGPKELVILLYR